MGPVYVLESIPEDVPRVLVLAVVVALMGEKMSLTGAFALPVVPLPGTEVRVPAPAGAAVLDLASMIDVPGRSLGR